MLEVLDDDRAPLCGDPSREPARERNLDSLAHLLLETARGARDEHAPILVERRGESIDEGFERLIAAAGAAARGTDSSFADRVYRAILDETPFDDDVALLAVETLPLEKVLELTLGTRPDVLGGMRTTLERWLTAAGASESERFDIALSTSEAATNAIEHAYGAREANFVVRAEREGNDVTVTVTDAGRWRTLRPHGGGRGLMIMRALMDAVEVNTDQNGTDVRMTKTLIGGE